MENVQNVESPENLGNLVKSKNYEKYKIQHKKSSKKAYEQYLFLYFSGIVWDLS